jgi:hypothetical protein
MGGELRVLAVAARPPRERDMSAATTTAVLPGTAAYKRQTPSVWQAVGRAIWNALQASGQRRAARELHELARRWDDIDPAMAARMRAAARPTTHDKKELKK